MEVYPRIRDVPAHEREAFMSWLNGQTRPYIDGQPWSEQDAYFEGDYERWKQGKAVIC